MEMAFHPQWTSFHNAKKSFQRGSLTTSRLCVNNGLRQKTLPEPQPYLFTACPWEISLSPPGTRIVKFTSPPALSTRPDWWLTAFFLLQRWHSSPSRGISIVILLRFCWIGVYCFDLCNDTYFSERLHVPFLQGIWSDEGQGASSGGEGCWRRDLEWWWCGFWPSSPEICTLWLKISCGYMD